MCEIQILLVRYKTGGNWRASTAARNRQTSRSDTPYAYNSYTGIFFCRKPDRRRENKKKTLLVNLG
jgi:hypothetical protein